MKKHGWLREIIPGSFARDAGWFIGGDLKLHFNFKHCTPYRTRREARLDKCSDERVRKVKLDRNGRAREIIKTAR